VERNVTQILKRKGEANWLQISLNKKEKRGGSNSPNGNARWMLFEGRKISHYAKKKKNSGRRASICRHSAGQKKRNMRV